MNTMIHHLNGLLCRQISVSRLFAFFEEINAYTMIYHVCCLLKGNIFITKIIQRFYIGWVNAMIHQRKRLIKGHSFYIKAINKIYANTMIYQFNGFIKRNIFIPGFFEPCYK